MGNHKLTPDPTTLPSTFQSLWKSSPPDPSSLPFPPGNPPIPLTPIDWHQLTLSDSDFTPHSWENLTELIEQGRLDELKRWPSMLRAYLAWLCVVKERWGTEGVGGYVRRERLGWGYSADDESVEEGRSSGEHNGKKVQGKGGFAVMNTTPFAHPDDYAILRNDWSYAMTPGIHHIVAWSKNPLPTDPNSGFLTPEGRDIVEGFVSRVFRRGVGEGENEKGSKVLWFRNPRVWQSVRSLEHVHVLVRGVEDGDRVLEGWLG